jgi:hypothetical protein
MKEFVDAFAGASFTHGSAYSVDGHSGAALWLPQERSRKRAELMARVLASTVARDRDSANLFALQKLVV